MQSALGFIAGRRVLAACLAAALCIQPATGQPETHTRPLRVGINTDYPPYEFTDPTGVPCGYDVDLVRAVARVMGRSVQFVPGAWSRVREDLEQGRLDVLAGMLYSEERDKVVDFSAPHLTVHYSIFVRPGGDTIRTLEDLRGREVIVERGSQMHDHLVATGLTDRLVLVDSEPAALRLLASGRHDAALVPLLQGLLLSRETGLRNVWTVGEPVLTRHLCFAVREGARELLDELNTGLAIIMRDGRATEIYDRWFGAVAPRASPYDAVARFTLWLLVPILAALILVAVWSWLHRPPESPFRIEPAAEPVAAWIDRRSAELIPCTLLCAALAAVYFATGRMGLAMAVGSPFATPVWPPSGIALAAMLLSRRRLWPGVFVGAASVNFSMGLPIMPALGIGVGNTLAAVTGAVLIGRFAHLRPSISRLQDAVGLILIGAILGSLIAAVAGTASISASGRLRAADLPGVLGTWWLGDAIGVMVVTPVLLTWTTSPMSRWRFAAVLELLALFAIMAVALTIVFGQPPAPPGSRTLLTYTVFPFVVWAGVRFGPPIGSLVTLLVAAVAAWSTAHGVGRLASPDPTTAMVLLTSFVGTISATSLTINAVVAERASVSEALRASQARLRMVVTHAPVVLFALDKDGTVLPSESRGLEALGLVPGQRLGRSASGKAGMEPALGSGEPGAPSPADGPGGSNTPSDNLAVHLDKALNGEPVQATIRRGELWFDVRCEPMRGPAGHVAGVAGVALDITDRVRAERARAASERRLRATLDSEPECVKVVSPDFTLLEMNPAGLAMIEADTPAQAIGGPVTSLIAPEHRDAFMALHRRVFAGESGSLMFEIIGVKGTRRWLESNTVPLRDEGGRILGALSVTRDISQRKRAEDELRRRSEELERSNRELERFAYVASHDLQEPLRMVTSFTQLLAKKYRGRLDADADEYVGFAVEGATRMQRLIEDLLAYSRLNSRPPEVGPVDAGQVVRAALQNLKDAIEEASAKITVGTLPVVEVDAVQLTQVFQNLLANAVKFRGERPPVIEVAARMERDAWEFAVSDNGIGIDPSHVDRLFVMFQRLHARSRYAGNGIGLAICKSIVERHGGRIWAESVPGSGSIFRFTIPRVTSPS
jgi:PAS domain S-box-containing protein